MKYRRTSLRILCGVAVAICLGSGITGCESYEEKRKREEAARQAREQRIQAQHAQIVSELRETYNADDEWSKVNFVWTVDMQDRLMRSSGQPIVGIALLRDVEKQGESYVVHLVPRSLELPLEFELECAQLPRKPRDAETVGSFFSEWLRSLSYPEYAFVAEIHRISRQDALLVDIRGEDGSIELDRRPRWIAEGKCLALREIPPEQTESGSESGKQ